MLVWFTIRWHTSPNIRSAILVGLIIGFIILIRPSEMVCLLIPLLWNVGNGKSFLRKINLLKENFSHVVALVVAMILVGSTQLIYWKLVTGNFLFYSYTNAGEGFEFLWPYTQKFLFSFRKGWFVYIPIMVLAVVGFYHLYVRNRKIFLPLFLFFILSVWIISSWGCWWYAGGSYSSRSLLPAYVLLAIPLGYFFEALSGKKILKNVIAVLIVLLIVLNLFQTWQWMNGIISKERMTRAYYMAVFGKTSVTEDLERLLMVERSTEAEEYFEDYKYYSQRNIYLNGFENQAAKEMLFHFGKASLVLNPASPWSPGP